VSGDNFTGDLQHLGLDNSIQGSVSGNTISFERYIDDHAPTRTQTWIGQLDGASSITGGRLSDPAYGDCTWSAKRSEAAAVLKKKTATTDQELLSETAAANTDGLTSGPASSGTYRFEAANYWHNEYKVLRNFTDQQLCAQRCAEDSNCKVATYSDDTAGGDWANTCVLRNAVGPRHTNQQGITSWVK